MTPDDVLLVQLEIPLDTVAAACARAAARDVRVVLNIAPYADLPAAVIQVADPLVANEHEAQLLGHTGARPRSRLVTLGAHGAVWDDLGLPAVEVPDDEVLDTTGRRRRLLRCARRRPGPRGGPGAGPARGARGRRRTPYATTGRSPTRARLSRLSPSRSQPR